MYFILLLLLWYWEILLKLQAMICSPLRPACASNDPGDDQLTRLCRSFQSSLNTLWPSAFPMWAVVCVWTTSWGFAVQPDYSFVGSSKGCQAQTSGGFSKCTLYLVWTSGSTIFTPQGYSLPVGEMEAHGLDVHQVLFQHILTVMLEVSLSWRAWGYAWPYKSCWVKVQGSVEEVSWIIVWHLL